MAVLKMDFPFTATLTHRARDAKDSDTWMVSIDGFVTSYSKGIGLREGFTLPFGRHTVADLEDFHNPKKSRTVDPTLPEVLYAIANDATAYLNAKDINDFAAEFGVEKISEATRMWRACRDAAKFFQSRSLDAFAYANEDE